LGHQADTDALSLENPIRISLTYNSNKKEIMLQNSKRICHSEHELDRVFRNLDDWNLKAIKAFHGYWLVDWASVTIKTMINSAATDGGPRSRVCAR
jgi:hypothetical protein